MTPGRGRRDTLVEVFLTAPTRAQAAWLFVTFWLGNHSQRGKETAALPVTDTFLLSRDFWHQKRKKKNATGNEVLKLMQSENVFRVEVYQKHTRPYVQVPPTLHLHRVVNPPPQFDCELSFIFGRHEVVQMPFLFSTSENPYGAISCLSDDERSINTNLPEQAWP